MISIGTTFSPLHNRIIDTIRKMLSNQYSICSAYLFGSFLRSDTYHDIDLALYLMQDPNPYERYKIGNRIGQEIEQVIQPRTHVDVRVLNNAPVAFSYEVISTGLLLFNKNDLKTTAFEADVLIQYLDMQPWLESLDQQYLEVMA